MDDLFVEILIKKEKGFKDTLIKTFCIALIVFFAALGLILHPAFLIGIPVMLLILYFPVAKLDIEYEYLYVNGTLDIDRIYAKRKRKSAASYELSQMEIFAKKDSPRLEPYTGNGITKVRDFTSGSPDREDQVYGFVISYKGNRELVYIEPNEKMLKDIRARNTSRVFLQDRLYGA